MADEIVQTTEQASTVEPASQTTQTTQTTTAPEPLTTEMVQKMIAEATAKAVAEAKDVGRRELQSQQDRNRAEIERAARRARTAETTLGTMRSRLAQLDPAAAQEAELAEYRTREQERAIVEQEEQTKAARTAFHQQFNTNLNQFITNLGVDPKDSRIDWGKEATEAGDYLAAQQKILDSIAKIKKEESQGLEKRLKEVETKVTKVDVEANSVDTTTSNGVVNSSDAAFLKAWGNGDLPSTKVNFERARKLANSD